MSVDIIRRTAQRQLTITGNCRESVERWALIQGKRSDIAVSAGMAIVVGKYILTNKHGQILSDRVSKVRPEHAHIKAATITHSDNGLGCNLIGHPQPRCESLVLPNVTV